MTAQRHITVCADDYGMAPGVSDAIRRLLSHRRINATSVMTVSPALDRDSIDWLKAIKRGDPTIAIGLHVTLTAPFTPLTAEYHPLTDGKFPPLGSTLALAMRRALRPDVLRAEIAAQLRAFAAAFDQAPDFVDGHQHVQLFPQVRDAFLDAVAEHAPQAWVRQGGRCGPLHRRLADRKALLLDILSIAFRRKAARHGIAFNPGFAGTYHFTGSANFAATFPRFLNALPDGGLVMCHPGFVDDTLRRVDPVTALREREYEFFMADAYPRLLAARNISLR